MILPVLIALIVFSPPYVVMIPISTQLLVVVFPTFPQLILPDLIPIFPVLITPTFIPLPLIAVIVPLLTSIPLPVVDSILPTVFIP